MVHHCWARCNLCDENIFGELNIWVPMCRRCGIDIANFYLHKKCMKIIFNRRTRKVRKFYKNKLKLYCKKCPDSRMRFEYIAFGEYESESN